MSTRLNLKLGALAMNALLGTRGLIARASRPGKSPIARRSSPLGSGCSLPRFGVVLGLGFVTAGLVWAGAVGASLVTGGSWKVQRSPSPSTSANALLAVAATSRTNAWAVGSSSKGTLIERWNGKA